MCYEPTRKACKQVRGGSFQVCCRVRHLLKERILKASGADLQPCCGYLAKFLVRLYRVALLPQATPCMLHDVNVFKRCPNDFRKGRKACCAWCYSDLLRARSLSYVDDLGFNVSTQMERDRGNKQAVKFFITKNAVRYIIAAAEFEYLNLYAPMTSA